MTIYKITGGRFEHVHLGDTIYNIYASGQTDDEPFAFDAYVKGVRDRLHREAIQHVQLDVEPVVRLAAGDHRTLPEAVLTEKHLVVLGAAGSGKTSSLRYLAAIGDADRELRAYVELSRYRKAADTSALDALLILVGEVMTDWSGAARPPSIPTIRRLLLDRPTMLLFDGLDEVDAAIRSTCLQAIADLAFAFAQCRIVLSTRPLGFEAPEHWTTVRLRELSNQQIEQLLRARTDDRTASVVRERLRLDNNPLLRLPLFLTYAIKLVQQSADGAARLLRSRTSIVSDYVAALFRDDRHGAGDEAQWRNALARLALRLQKVGQSLPVSDVTESPEIIAALALRGFLRVDGRYVRFSHQTIQEFFFAEGLRRRFAHSSPFLRRWRMRAVIAKPVHEDALTFLPVDTTDHELGTLMRVAVRRNIALAMRWADDLATDGRAPDVVSSFVASVRRRLVNAANYSRVTHERRPVLATTVLTFSSLLALGFHDTFARTPTPTSGALAYGVMPAIAILALHYLLTYRGCSDARTIAGKAATSSSSLLQAELRSVFEKVVASSLCSYDLRYIALAVVERGQELEDPLEAISKSHSPYLTIHMVAFSDSLKTFDVLHATVEAGRGNLFSRAALQAMLYRAIRKPEEAKRLREVARRIWHDRGDWLYRRAAGRCLATLEPAFRGAYRLRAWSHAVFGVLGIVVATTIGTVFVLSVFDLLTRSYFRHLSADRRAGAEIVVGALAALAFSFSSGAFMFLCALGLKTRRVGGYPGFDSWPPWAYFVWATVMGIATTTFFPITLFVIRLRRIQNNARGLDIAQLRRIVQEKDAEPA